MPTYQYACTECGAPHEAVQSFTDPALTECPACGGRLRKVYGAVGVVFKGSGFYKTDSRGDGAAGAKGGGEKPGDKSGDKPGEKSGGKAGAASGDGAGTSSTGSGSSGSGSSGSGSSGSGSGAAPAKSA